MSGDEGRSARIHSGVGITIGAYEGKVCLFDATGGRATKKYPSQRVDDEEIDMLDAAVCCYDIAIESRNPLGI